MSVGVEFRPFPLENPRDMSDNKLLELCLSANATEAAWQELVHRIQKTIRGPIYRALSHSKAAATASNIDEIVQRTLFKLVEDDCRRLREFKFQHENALRPFLCVVAVRLAFDFVRGFKPNDPLPEVDPPDPRPGPVKTIELNEMFDDVKKHVSELDFKIFELHYRWGFSAREISEMPGIELELKQVEYILWRLMKFLKEKYGGSSGGPPPKPSN